MNSFAAAAHGHRICLLEFAIVLKMKDNKSDVNVTAANRSIMRMWLS